MASIYTTDEEQQWMKSLHKRFSSAAMIIENDKDEVLIVKANYKTHWTFPGGIIDPGESPLEAACRETKEEVGLTVEPSNAAFVLVADRRSRFAESYQFVFKARQTRDVLAQKIILQDDEIDEYRFVSREQVLSGDLVYGKAIKHWANNVTGYIEQTFTFPSATQESK